MVKPPESGENLEYNYDPHFDWERETQDILDNLRKDADAIIAQERNQRTPSVTAPQEETIELKVDNNNNNIENIDNKTNSNILANNSTPSVPTLWHKIRRPLLLTSCFVFPLALLIWQYNNTIKTCENTGVLYKNQFICGDTPEKKDAIYEYIACDYIQTHLVDNSFLVAFGEFDKMQRDSVVPALETHIQGDKFSFRKNVAIAYFNSATKFINQKQMDSACWAFINSYQYFEKLDASRTNDTLKKMTQIALQSANICEAPIQLDYPTFSPKNQNRKQTPIKYAPQKNNPIKRVPKNRIESRLDDAPIPPEVLEKKRYDKQKQADY